MFIRKRTCKGPEREKASHRPQTGTGLDRRKKGMKKPAAPGPLTHMRWKTTCQASSSSRQELCGRSFNESRWFRHTAIRLCCQGVRAFRKKSAAWRKAAASARGAADGQKACAQQGNAKGRKGRKRTAGKGSRIKSAVTGTGHARRRKTHERHGTVQEAEKQPERKTRQKREDARAEQGAENVFRKVCDKKTAGLLPFSVTENAK